MSGNSTSRPASTLAPGSLPPEEVIFGGTLVMRTIRHQLEKVCGTNVPVLIQGGNGSGKEILARWIHRQSPWGSGPFIKVNFAAIPGSLLESELFGYEPGAFTGANSSRMGRVEMAQGGTLFLDQMTDLDPSFQAKLLQLLQDGRFSRLGAQEERRIEARVICASCRRLEDAVKAGHFRQDLYYRVNVFEVDLPPLSARREDIPAIANYLLSQLNIRFQRETSKLEESKLRLLQKRDWPGNIRQMENWISRYVLLGDEESAQVDATWGLPVSNATEEAHGGAIPLKRIVRQARQAMSRDLILKALQANRWNRRKAAKDLKISYRTLLYEIREVGLPSKRAQKHARQSEDTPSSVSTSAD